jgi:hypothetical protein
MIRTMDRDRLLAAELQLTVWHHAVRTESFRVLADPAMGLGGMFTKRIDAYLFTF